MNFLRQGLDFVEVLSFPGQLKIGFKDQDKVWAEGGNQVEKRRWQSEKETMKEKRQEGDDKKWQRSPALQKQESGTWVGRKTAQEETFSLVVYARRVFPLIKLLSSKTYSISASLLQRFYGLCCQGWEVRQGRQPGRFFADPRCQPTVDPGNQKPKNCQHFWQLSFDLIVLRQQHCSAVNTFRMFAENSDILSGHCGMRNNAIKRGWAGQGKEGRRQLWRELGCPIVLAKECLSRTQSSAVPLLGSRMYLRSVWFRHLFPA